MKKKLDKANEDLRHYAYLSRRPSKSRLGLRKTNKVFEPSKDEMRDLFYECVNETMNKSAYIGNKKAYL